jgi:hypothetical protein
VIEDRNWKAVATVSAGITRRPAGIGKTSGLGGKYRKNRRRYGTRTAGTDGLDCRLLVGRTFTGTLGSKAAGIESPGAFAWRKCLRDTRAMSIAACASEGVAEIRSHTLNRPYFSFMHRNVLIGCFVADYLDRLSFLRKNFRATISGHHSLVFISRLHF